MMATTFLLFGCDASKENTFSFYNSSLRIVDSVKVSSIVAEMTLVNIKPNESQSRIYRIMNQSNHDGAFRAYIYFSDTTVVTPTFGYFSNDRDVAKHLSLEIDKNLSVREK